MQDTSGMAITLGAIYPESFYLHWFFKRHRTERRFQSISESNMGLV
jgi:hypothetical protein